MFYYYCLFFSPVQQIVDNMVHLAAGSSNDKLEAVEALICEMNKTSDMASGVPQVCLFSSCLFFCCALILINLFAAQCFYRMLFCCTKSLQCFN